MLNGILLLICLIPAAVLCDDCQEVPVKPDVDVKQLQGWWFIRYASKVSKGWNGEFKCMMEHIFPTASDGSFNIVSIILPNNGVRTSEGGSYYGKVHQNGTDGVLVYELYNKEGKKNDIPVKLIATDYNTYMISNFCFSEWDGNWIYTRSPKPITDEEIKAIEGGLESLKLTMDDFVPTVFAADTCP